MFDAGALAMFVVIGTIKGMEYGVGPLASVFVGLFTGIGGGLVRDLLVDEAPIVLRERELYAIPATLGAMLTAATVHFDVFSPWVGAAIAFAILTMRLVSLKMNWQAPGPWQGFGRQRTGR